MCLVSLGLLSWTMWEDTFGRTTVASRTRRKWDDFDNNTRLSSSLEFMQWIAEDVIPPRTSRARLGTQSSISPA